MQFPPQLDAIDQHIANAERTRKLEIMSHSRTLIPRQWVPNRDELDLIVGATALHGLFASNASQQPVAQPGYPQDLFQIHPGPGAHSLWSTLTREGFPNAATAQDFTMFWETLSAIPPTTMWDQMSFISDASLDPQVVAGAVGTGPACIKGISGGDDASGRHFWYIGLPKGKTGDYRFTPPGTYSGMVVPDLGHLNDPVTDALIVAPGAYLLMPEGLDGIIQRQNFWVTTAGDGGADLHDCLGPDAPMFNAADQPGLPLTYNAGPDPCPDAPPGSENNRVGYIMRARSAASPLDPYLCAPPTWNTANTPFYNRNDVIDPFYNTPAWPGWYEMGQHIQSILPFFPSVDAWYSSHMPSALAARETAEARSWQALEITRLWQGLIEFRVENGFVILRGKVRINASPVVGGAQIIAILPDGKEFPYRAGNPGEWVQNMQFPVRMTDFDGTVVPAMLKISAGTSDGSTPRSLIFDQRIFDVTPATNGPYTVDVGGIRLPIDLAYQPPPPVDG